MLKSLYKMSLLKKKSQNAQLNISALYNLPKLIYRICLICKQRSEANHFGSTILFRIWFLQPKLVGGFWFAKQHKTETFKRKKKRIKLYLITLIFKTAFWILGRRSCWHHHQCSCGRVRYINNDFKHFLILRARTPVWILDC